VQATTAVEKPPVARALLELADRADIDLIAMCTHGRSGLDRWMFGSVAEWLLRAARTPILLVRAKPANSGRVAFSAQSSQEHSRAQA
jgi:nucleotide-binding universal stress UspA family protein